MQLIHGDCLVEMQKIPDHSVDMILCGLPYGTTACPWDVTIPFEPLWEQYKRIRKQKCAIVLFGSEPFSTLLRMSNFNEYKYDWVWRKNQVTGIGTSNKIPMKAHENISIFYNGLPIFNKQFKQRLSIEGKHLAAKGLVGGQHTSNIKQISSPVPDRRFYNPQLVNPQSVIDEFPCVSNGGKVRFHPTEKPVPLLEYLIRTYTNEGDLVLDNCMGSGSTGIACLNTSRDFIGIELYPLPDKPISKTNPDYFNLAKNRIAKWKFEPIYNEKEEQINLF